MKEARNWTWQIITGVVILFCGALHMITVHMDDILGWFNPAGGKAVEWANVAARSADTTSMVIYIILLGATLYHGLYGIRNIVFELRPSAGIEKLITVLLWLAGLGIFAVGFYGAVALKMV